MFGSRFTALALVLASSASNAAVAPFDVGEFNARQKAAYEARDWNLFFGAAQAYRKLWWESARSADAVLLESLALVRHCQFALAAGVLSELRSRTDESDKSGLDRIASIEALIPGIDTLKAAPGAGVSGARARNESLWPTGQAASGALARPPSPFAFRAKVVNQCGD